MAGAARACPCRACIPLNDLSEVRMGLLCAKGNHRINAHRGKTNAQADGHWHHALLHSEAGASASPNRFKKSARAIPNSTSCWFENAGGDVSGR